MGTYAAFEYTQTDAFRNMDEEEANWNPIKAPLPQEPEEEIKIRVWFTDNNYFDDHFDLKRREHLIGKTLAKFAQCTKRHFLTSTSDNNATIVKHSLELLGWTLFEKWDKVIEIVARTENISGVAKNCLDMVNFFCNKNTDSKNKESVLEALQKLKPVDMDVSKYLNEQVKLSVSENENQFVNIQLGIYSDWMRQRNQEVKSKLELWEANERKQRLEQKKKELDREEEKLFFFENYERMEKKKQAKYRE